MNQCSPDCFSRLAHAAKSGGRADLACGDPAMAGSVHLCTAPTATSKTGWRISGRIFKRPNCWLKSKRPDLDQQLDQAQAQLVLAQANLHLAEQPTREVQHLFEDCSVSEQEAAEKSAARENCGCSVEAERANVRRLQELVSFQRVIAPLPAPLPGVKWNWRPHRGRQRRPGIVPHGQTGKLRVYVHCRNLTRSIFHPVKRPH